MEIMEHEIAHAFYTVNLKYHKEVNKLLQSWRRDPSHKSGELDSAWDVLKIMGYHVSTIDDEIHAYCATGLSSDLKGVISKKEMKPFQKLFKEFREQCGNDKSK